MDDPQRLALRLEHQSLDNGSWMVSSGFASEDPQSSSTRSKPMRLNSHPQLQSQSSVGKQLSQSVSSLSQAPSQARPFDCPWEGGCHKRFNRKSDLQRHYRIHTNERPYSCKVPGCGKSFIQRSALTVHHRTHSGEKPHVCEVETCGKKFSDSSSLARHRRIHTGKRPYKCPVPPCEKSFCRKTTLTKHAERSHRDFSTQQPYRNEFDVDDEDEDEDEDALEEEGMMRQNSATVAPRYNRNLWLAQSPAYPSYIGGELNGPRASSRVPYHNVSRSTELIGYPHPDLGMGQVEDLTVHQHGRHPSRTAQMSVQNESYFGQPHGLPHLDTNAMSRSYSTRGINSATTDSTIQSPEQFLSSADSFQSSPSSIEHDQLLQDIPRSCEQPSLSHDPYASIPSNAQYQQSFGPQIRTVPYPQMNDLPLRNVQYGSQDITAQEVAMPLHIQIQHQGQESLSYEPTQISPQQPMVLYHDSAMPSSGSLQPSPSQLQHQPPQPTAAEMDMIALEQQRHYEAERQREEHARHEEFLRQEQQRHQEEAAMQAQQHAAFESERMQREEHELALKTLQEAKQLALQHRQQQQQQQVRAEEPQYATAHGFQDEWAPEAYVEAVPASASYPQYYEYPPQPAYGLGAGVGVEEWKEHDEYTIMPNQRIPSWDGPC